jgi:GNAT superfamily N-acetyltransferase
MLPPPVVINSVHDLKNFDCGNPALNEFLVKYALTNTSAGVARTYVATSPASTSVIGYYSIATGSIERDNSTTRVAKGIPRHPVPVALIARLAVDRQYQGKGIGEGMLKHAIQQILGASSIIGIRAILVHAKNQQAADFYKKYDFHPSPTNDLHLMMLIKDAKASLGLPS